MMTMADKRCMIDTNILIYSTVSSSPYHEDARQQLATLFSNEVVLCITSQIMREYLVVLTRGNVFLNQFTIGEAWNELESIMPAFNLLKENEETVHNLRELTQRYQVKGKAIHDANIVATMLAHGLTNLMTYNIGDFQRYQEINLIPMRLRKLGGKE